MESHVSLKNPFVLFCFRYFVWYGPTEEENLCTYYKTPVIIIYNRVSK